MVTLHVPSVPLCMDLSAVGSELVVEEPVVEPVGTSLHIIIKLQQVGLPKPAPSSSGIFPISSPPL